MSSEDDFEETNERLSKLYEFLNPTDSDCYLKSFSVDIASNGLIVMLKVIYSNEMTKESEALDFVLVFEENDLSVKEILRPLQEKIEAQKDLV